MNHHHHNTTTATIAQLNFFNRKVMMVYRCFYRFHYGVSTTIEYKHKMSVLLLDREDRDFNKTRHQAQPERPVETLCGHVPFHHLLQMKRLLIVGMLHL
ncbi:hypothetical protein HanIR_Chr14g0673151 [Helianthus annuus]|nr:hypothetical protein HanIR_Chr14g0673151 [Helianthus annuus]